MDYASIMQLYRAKLKCVFEHTILAHKYSHKTGLIYIDAIKQSACIASDPITIDHFTCLFNCTPVGPGSDSMTAPTWKKKQKTTNKQKYSLDAQGWNFLCLFLGSSRFNWRFSFAPVLQWCGLATQGSPSVSTRCFCWVFISVLLLALSVIPVSILRKSISARQGSWRADDGPM